MLSTQLAKIKRKWEVLETQLHLIVVWFHWKLRTKKEELLRAISSKKNFSNSHSAAFVTVFAHNLVHAYKFRIFQKTAREIFL